MTTQLIFNTNEVFRLEKSELRRGNNDELFVLTGR